MYKYHYDYEGQTLKVNLDKQLGSGGEGAVYTLSYESMQVQSKLDHCAKKYHNLSPITIQKLELMINTDSKYRFEQADICWPLAFLKDNQNHVVGYIMPKAKSAIPLRTWMITPARKSTFAWNRNNLCDLIISILNKFKLLHDSNIIVGDINDANILVNPQNPSECSFVDTDSYQIGDFYCPVGAEEFIAPELLGVKLSTVKRTLNHEYYTLAVLLFKILILGQHPYAVIGGDSVINNIKNRNFPYPIGTYDGAIPLGKYLDYWNILSYALREMFYDVFKKNNRKSVESWLNCIKEYDQGISKLEYPLTLDDEANNKIFIQTKFDDGRKRGEGSTYLTVVKPDAIKICVLELSTRAVKYMIADTAEALAGFSWNAFKNQADLTNTGQLLNEKHELDVVLFKRKVLPMIMKHVNEGLKSGATHFCCIATAAYRVASNRTDILNIIKNEIKNKHHINFEIQILDRNQEADYTYKAFRWSMLHESQKSILLIDQGGGSTEISLFRGGQKIASANIPMGTESMFRLLFINSFNNKDLKSCIEDADKWSKRNTFDALKKLLNFIIQEKIEFDIVGLGTAITKATKKTSNQKQHGTILKKEYIQEVKNEYIQMVVGHVKSMKNLEEFVNTKVTSFSSSSEDIYEKFIIIFGLMMYQHILDRLTKQQIMVSGTGLRYGVLEDFISSIASDMVMSKKIIQHKQESSVHNGFKVGEVYDGTINNIKEFGCFVTLSAQDFGLIHISQFLKHQKKLDSLDKGASIKVKILGFKIENNKVKVDLDYVSGGNY